MTLDNLRSVALLIRRGSRMVEMSVNNVNWKEDPRTPETLPIPSCPGISVCFLHDLVFLAVR